MRRVNIRITGDVQAVGFRYTAIEVARDLGLTGWVKNNPDDSVQIVAEGEKESLENLITWTKQGPSVARVERIETIWEKASGEFSSFEARY